MAKIWVVVGVEQDAKEQLLELKNNNKFVSVSAALVYALNAANEKLMKGAA